MGTAVPLVPELLSAGRAAGSGSSIGKEKGAAGSKRSGIRTAGATPLPGGGSAVIWTLPLKTMADLDWLPVLKMMFRPAASSVLVGLSERIELLGVVPKKILPPPDDESVTLSGVLPAWRLLLAGVAPIINST